MSVHEDLVAAAVAVRDHLPPLAHGFPERLHLLDVALPSDPTQEARRDEALLLDLAGRVRQGVDVRPELLPVLARNAAVVEVAHMASLVEDRTWLLTGQGTVLVNWDRTYFDLRDPCDEVGVELGLGASYGRKFDQLHHGPVHSAVREELAR